MVHRKEGLDVLFFAAKQTLLDVWAKEKKGVPGIIAVMHTFGGDLKWNPHMHCIVTCGGLDEKRWRPMTFIPYERLKGVWKYHVVSGLREMGKKRWNGVAYTTFNRWLDFLYQKKWYVNVGERLDSLEFTIKYIGRYAKRPVMAETRLKSFDGETVEVSHKDKKLQREVMLRMPVGEFIGKLVRHIPEKHHRMIRYSGIFASRVKQEKLGLVWAALEGGVARLCAKARAFVAGADDRVDGSGSVSVCVWEDDADRFVGDCKERRRMDARAGSTVVTEKYCTLFQSPPPLHRRHRVIERHTLC